LFRAAGTHHVERRRLREHQRIERAGVRLPRDVARGMHAQELPGVVARGDDFVQHDQPIRFGIRQRPQQDRVDDRENGRVGADREGEREDGDGAESGILEERAQRVGQILAHDAEPLSEDTAVRRRGYIPGLLHPGLFISL
jgi:hypothetical protein